MLVLTLLAGAAAFALVSLLSLYAPGVLATRSRIALTVVAAAAAWAGVLMPGRPTGLLFVDGAYRGIFVALIVVAGRYARRDWVLVSAVLALAASPHSPLVWLPFAAAGVMVANVLGHVRQPLV